MQSAGLLLNTLYVVPPDVVLLVFFPITSKFTCGIPVLPNTSGSNLNLTIAYATPCNLSEDVQAPLVSEIKS